MAGPAPRLVRLLLKGLGLAAEEGAHILPSVAKVEYPMFRNTTELLAEARRLNYGGINDGVAKTLTDVFPNAQMIESAPRPRSVPSAVENVETAFKARATAREGAPTIGKSGIQHVDDVKTTDGGTLSTYRLPDGRTGYVRWSPKGNGVAHVEYTGINPVGGPDFESVIASPALDANTVGRRGVVDVIADMKQRHGLDAIEGVRITGATAKARGEGAGALLLDPRTGEPYGAASRIGRFAALPLASAAKAIPGYQPPVEQAPVSAPIATAQNPRVGTDLPAPTPEFLASMTPILGEAMLGQDIGEGLTRKLSPYVGARLFGQ